LDQTWKLFRYDCLPFICWQNKRGKAEPAEKV